MIEKIIQQGRLVPALMLIFFGVLVFTAPAMAFDFEWTFVLTSGGDLEGGPGQTLTWTYDIANKDSDSNHWLDLSNLDAGLWPDYGIPESLFISFPTYTLKSGDSISGNLYNFTWNPADVPVDTVILGKFYLTGYWYDGNPYPPEGQEPGSLKFTETKEEPYSATFISGPVNPIPEPASLLLLGAGLLGIFRFKKIKV